MGFLYPHVNIEVYFVFLQSLLCELGELAAGERARFLVDPGVNVLGYVLGCVTCQCCGGGKRRADAGSDKCEGDNEENARLVEVVIR